MILSGPLGAIGTGPNTPEPPLRTFSISLAVASWPLYFAAISLKDGPTIFLSLAWQAMQPALFIASSGPAAQAVAANRAAMAITICFFMLALLDQYTSRCVL